MFGTVARAVAVAAVAAAAVASPRPVSSSGPVCRGSESVAPLRELPEASGVAASRRTPGVFWAHNDSGDAVLFALDDRGAITGRVRVTGAAVQDWEDIAVGPCGRSSCIFIADIGDNDGSRPHVTIYRVPEPAPGAAATERAEVFHAAYPDGPRDAESLFVARGSEVFVITKGDPGPVALYRFPLASEATAQLQRIGPPLARSRVDAADRPTAADASPDGRWVAMRTTRWVAFFATADLLAGRPREAYRADVSGLNEPQGEGLAFAGPASIVLVGEAGGSDARAGTFARLACTLGSM